MSQITPPSTTPRGRLIRGPWRRAGRAFQAATASRLTADWPLFSGDINQELRHALPVLRARGRDLEQNTAHGRRYLQLVETHIVGAAGFGLQVRGELRSGKTDQAGNRAVERGFARWAKRGVCTLDGRHAFADFCRLAVRGLARDGEALVRFWDVRPTPANPAGFCVELLDPARLDHQRWDDHPRIRLGVELGTDNRPRAYHLLTGRDLPSYGETHQRVPAEDLLHLYRPDVPEQVRGASWLAVVAVDLHMRDAYQDAAVVAARVGASKLGFYKTPDGRLESLADGAKPDDAKKDEDEFFTEVEPGHFSSLPPGYEFQGFSTDYPDAAYEPFIRAIDRWAASALGVSYHALTGDLRDVNFSSIRSGTLEERERWMVLQDFIADALLTPIYLRWLSAALAQGALGVRLDPQEALVRYGEHKWQGRRWPWVDPQSDIEATRLAISSGLKSPQQAAAESGGDLEDLIDQLAAAQQLAEAKGVALNWLAPTIPATQPAGTP